jgi:membrane-bound metal-dependent hydrolase YbcI (DUF457 family)
MTDTKDEISWPSAVVAVFLILLVMAVTVAAIVRYPADDAMKFWSALGPVIGVLTGAFVTYFFTRRTIATEQASAAAARKEADESQQAMAAMIRHVDRPVLNQLKTKHPALARIAPLD